MNDELDKELAEAAIARTTAALVDKAHQLEQRVSDAKERVEQRVSDAKERVEHMVDPRERVREQPWQSLGVAFGVGFVLGLLS